MDCRNFRDNHSPFVDGLVVDHELAAMQAHLVECPACATHDATIRRALLLFRNIPQIEPSSEFRAKLDARIRAERKVQRRLAGRAGYGGFGGRGTYAAAVAGVMAAGFILVSVIDNRSKPPATVPAVVPLALSPLLVAATPPVPRQRATTLAAASVVKPRVTPTFVGYGMRPAQVGLRWDPLGESGFNRMQQMDDVMWQSPSLVGQTLLVPEPMQVRQTNLER